MRVLTVSLHWFKLLVVFFFFKVRATLYISAGGRKSPKKICVQFELM